jgi:hypothetical protein
MGYCYSHSGRLCCDACGADGGVRKRTCPFKVILADGRTGLPYCYPSALCAKCYAIHKHTLHASCREGAAARTAAEAERARQVAAGAYEVKAAWGSWHALVPEGSTGVVFVNPTRGEEYRLVPADRYAPGERRYLSDYPEASPWCGPDATTKEVRL